MPPPRVAPWHTAITGILAASSALGREGQKKECGVRGVNKPPPFTHVPKKTNSQKRGEQTLTKICGRSGENLWCKLSKKIKKRTWWRRANSSRPSDMVPSPNDAAARSIPFLPLSSPTGRNNHRAFFWKPTSRVQMTNFLGFFAENCYFALRKNDWFS